MDVTLTAQQVVKQVAANKPGRTGDEVFDNALLI
jgi:hypothetical protein